MTFLTLTWHLGFSWVRYAPPALPRASAGLSHHNLLISARSASSTCSETRRELRIPGIASLARPLLLRARHAAIRGRATHGTRRAGTRPSACPSAFRGRNDRRPDRPATARRVPEPLQKMRLSRHSGRWSSVMDRWCSAPAVPFCGTNRPSKTRFRPRFWCWSAAAGSLWVRDSLGPWLYQVAVRVSRSARSAEIRRRRHEREKAEQTDISVFDRAWDDLGPVIHEELARLPEQFRAAVVLCCMEGLSQQQAAGQLGWPLGTLQSRLARGRERLRGRLVAQGPGPLSRRWSRRLCQPDRAEAAIPVALANSTVRMAMQFAAGNAAVAGVAAVSAALLTRGVLENHVSAQIENRDRCV